MHITPKWMTTMYNTSWCDGRYSNWSYFMAQPKRIIMVLSRHKTNVFAFLGYIHVLVVALHAYIPNICNLPTFQHFQHFLFSHGAEMRLSSPSQFAPTMTMMITISGDPRRKLPVVFLKSVSIQWVIFFFLLTAIWKESVLSRELFLELLEIDLIRAIFTITNL